MQGTYRMYLEPGAGLRTVAFPGERRTRVRTALRVTSSLALGAMVALVPANPFLPTDRGAQQIVVLPQPRVAMRALDLPEPPKAYESPATAPVVADPAATAAEQNAATAPVMLAVTPTAPAPAFGVPPAAPRQDLAALMRPRKVDIAQVTAPEARSLHVPQLREPGLVAGAPATLAAKVAAMQVSLPGLPRLTGEERAALLAETSDEMTVRIGDDAVGKVAFRMSEIGSIDVQLSGLLDLVADRMAPGEFTRLRSSAAADSYVSIDELRAIGLSLRYDPVYDELDLSA